MHRLVSLSTCRLLFFILVLPAFIFISFWQNRPKTTQIPVLPADSAITNAAVLSPPKQDVNKQVSLELEKLHRDDIPSVEDVGEAFLAQWFAAEKKFCAAFHTDFKNNIWPASCSLSCIHSGQIFGVPESLQRNLIIIPFRNRHSNLKELLPRIQHLLQLQKLCSLIVVVEQAGEDYFNKGILMNAGFIEALNWFPFHCVTLHDVDLLPISDQTPYNCAVYPRHTSVRVDKFGHKLPYEELIGGVLTIPVKMFLRVNGYSNLYWAWGGEDDDMYKRLMANGISVTRPHPDVSIFHMIPHKHSPEVVYTRRLRLLEKTRSIYRLDGINSLNYTVLRMGNLSDWMNITGYYAPAKHLQIDVGFAPTWIKRPPNR